MLRTRRVTITRRNQPIEYATSVYRGDKYRFYTRMVRDRGTARKGGADAGMFPTDAVGRV